MSSEIAPADANSISPDRLSLVAALRQLYAIMVPSRLRQFYLVLGLMLLGAFAELVAIGSVLPFLALLAHQDLASELPWIGGAFATVGAETPSEQLLLASAAFMVAAVMAAAIRLWLVWVSQKFVLQFGHELSVEIQRRILFQPYSYHLAHNSSEVVASLEMVQQLVFGVLLKLMQAATAIVISLFIILLLLQIEPLTAAAAALAIAAIYGVVSLFARRKLARNSEVLGSAYEQRIKTVQESLGGIRDVIIDEAQEIYVESFRDIDRRFTLAQASTAFLSSAPRFVIEAAGIVLIAALALAVAGREGGFAAALPLLGALALAAQRLLPLIQQFYHGWTVIAGSRSVVGRVLKLLSLPAPPPHSVARRADPLPFQRAIRFENVGFSYAGRRVPAVCDIDLTIRRGERVALIGRTGSGKSTLADLLMGLLEPTSGRITVDGVPVSGETIRAWQQNIAHVPQSIFLSDGSIAENIALGVPPERLDMERVRSAAATAQLEDFIESLPDGYRTHVGERGVRMSGGQRQRLGIARAVYKDVPVLVLDEATSALDEETEAAVLASLDALQAQGRTIVIITHRRSAIERCDLVARIEKGRIAGCGSFAQVVGDGPARTGTG